MFCIEKFSDTKELIDSSKSKLYVMAKVHPFSLNTFPISSIYEQSIVLLKECKNSNKERVHSNYPVILHVLDRQKLLHLARIMKTKIYYLLKWLFNSKNFAI